MEYLFELLDLIADIWFWFWPSSRNEKDKRRK
jgi:hypothetical protein